MSNFIRSISIAFIFLFLAGLSVRAQNTNINEVKEYYLKALFMYNFARNVDWGPYAKENEFDISVLGNSPIALPLVALANSEAAGNRKVVIHQFKYPYEISFTNILFIARDYAFPLSSFLHLVAPGTLTVTEEDNIADEGIAFNLVIDDNRLKYQANVKAITAAGLTASPDLLQYAIAQPKELPQLTMTASTGAPAIEIKKPVFVRDRDYPEGVTEEIKTEPKMVIYRTVIKNKNSSVIFQKIAYDWGGVFYFRNNSSVSETTYSNEIKKAKDTLTKDKQIQ